MKKQLEADLISIAHRLLKIKNKSDINQLYLETQKLYEKLAVLQFVDQHFSETRPTIGRIEIEKEIESIFDESQSIAEQKSVEKVAEDKIEVILDTELVSSIEKIESVTEEIISNKFSLKETYELEIESKIVEEITETTAQSIAIVILDQDSKEIKNQEETDSMPLIPVFKLPEIEEDNIQPTVSLKTEAVHISFEDLLGGNYHDTLFVKKQQVENIPITVVIESLNLNEPEQQQKQEVEKSEVTHNAVATSVSLNEKLSKGIDINLNDRLAFIKHLFNNNSEDYNRVLNQLITFKTFYETSDFIQEMVKPDYKNWEGKQEYEDRFMNIIEKKFF